MRQDRKNNDDTVYANVKKRNSLVLLSVWIIYAKRTSGEKKKEKTLC